jgi:hypothetical protein
MVESCINTSNNYEMFINEYKLLHWFKLKQVLEVEDYFLHKGAQIHLG